MQPEKLWEIRQWMKRQAKPNMKVCLRAKRQPHPSFKPPPHRVAWDYINHENADVVQWMIAKQIIQATVCNIV